MEGVGQGCENSRQGERVSPWREGACVQLEFWVLGAESAEKAFVPLATEGEGR